MSKSFPPERIRNFSIIAHIDHGKSTLADRFLGITGAVDERERKAQQLDSMDLERERGITIKAAAVSLTHKVNGVEYLLNLIDTPGHVDFAYEVEKSLQACEGALLLIDAAQGIQAQTVANAGLAMDLDMTVLPVFNKVDLPHARPEEIEEELENTLLLERETALRCSAKTGEGVEDIIGAVVENIPAPQGDPDAPLQALIFDAKYDEYRGIVVYLRIMNGTLRKGDVTRMIGAEADYEAVEIGKFMPQAVPHQSLSVGEVGYFISNIRKLDDVNVGDTMTVAKGEMAPALEGYREAKPMVWCGIYPVSSGDFENLRAALNQLKLNDSSIIFEPESSDALGFGFRCGFLGLLHMEIVQERLERESGVDVVQTAPSVPYQIKLADGTYQDIHSPGSLPDPTQFTEILEPMVETHILIPAENIGALMGLCAERRGKFLRQEHLSANRVMITWDLPLAEIIYDFYDKLKSGTKGYGTMNFDEPRFEAARLVKLRILVSGEEADALSVICHADACQRRGRAVLKVLRKEIPRHQFEVALQAAVGGKIMARENIRALSKNVTAKCYGGDITRKRKLLAKQKEGKKRMKSIGNVEVPQKAFLAVLSTDE
ncbi:MAG: elongation factor 4 [Planctomycetes bacterium]|nr:elongation factor 4 [Planctomycetota bacterium]MCP4770069.1 elongation factor 4 [Planctomycetota bacterium]MCP4860783.1 elongation factor 4 [Planctomycetota bacterium]